MFNVYIQNNLDFKHKTKERLTETKQDLLC